MKIEALRQETKYDLSQYQEHINMRFSEASNVVQALGQTVTTIKKGDSDMKQIVNTKGMLPPNNLTGASDYKHWAKRFVAYHSLHNPEWEMLLEDLEVNGKDEITEERKKNMERTYVDLEKYDKALYSILVNNTTEKSEAAEIVGGVEKGNGIEAWRRLRQRFDPITPHNTINGMVVLNSWPPAKDATKLLEKIAKWEAYYRDYIARGNEKYTDSHRTMCIVRLCPPDLYTYFLQQIDRLGSYDAVRKEMVAVAERKNPGAPMEIGNMQEETGPEAQAAAAAAAAAAQ